MYVATLLGASLCYLHTPKFRVSLDRPGLGDSNKWRFHPLWDVLWTWDAQICFLFCRPNIDGHVHIQSRCSSVSAWGVNGIVLGVCWPDDSPRSRGRGQSPTRRYLGVFGATMFGDFTRRRSFSSSWWSWVCCRWCKFFSIFDLFSKRVPLSHRIGSIVWVYL